jgi:uncharacterized protein YozE (UPF0346 family)
MIFKEWIMQFEKDDSPIGDLAKDIKRDKQFPSNKDYKSILDYLESNRACYGEIEAFEHAFEIYKEDQNV